MDDLPMVYVVDDDETLRESLAFVLTSVGVPVRTFCSALEFLKDLDLGARGCVVTDIRMPGMSGIDLMTRLRALGSTLGIIVVTGHGDVPLAVEAMRLGAEDFIEKPFKFAEFVATIRAVLGRSSMTNAIESWRAGTIKRLSSLSQREKQVLEGILKGQANKVVAANLGISPRTVEIHRARLMKKMGARSLSELIRMGLAAPV